MFNGLSLNTCSSVKRQILEKNEAINMRKYTVNVVIKNVKESAAFYETNKHIDGYTFKLWINNSFNNFFKDRCYSNIFL